MSPSAPTNHGHDWPAYCCAILRDAAGRLLLELRPGTARHAPNQFTCFGGLRETGESPEDCIARELREELGIIAGNLRHRLTLLGDGPVAWFFTPDEPLPSGQQAPRCRVRGHQAVWVEPERLATLTLSPWHRAAIDAYLDGKTVAMLPVTPAPPG